MESTICIEVQNLRLSINSDLLSVIEKFMLQLLVDKTRFGCSLDKEERDFALALAMRTANMLN